LVVAAKLLGVGSEVGEVYRCHGSWVMEASRRRWRDNSGRMIKIRR